VSLGARWADRRASGDSEWLIDHASLNPPNVLEGTEAALFGTLTYLDAMAYGRSHSLENGRLVQFTADHANEAWGSDVTQTRLLGAWNEYLPLPAGDNHVLKLSGLYGVGFGDQTAQSLFGLVVTCRCCR